MLRCQNTFCLNWQHLLVGLFFIIMQCDARAVNVSNTWTMPQEGLNVFYRFFRDRISWFEADAVCQFHHANLVTVDNSFQFDATRDLLRELDVNDIVWIGLMRPQSSDRFMWSNSRPLVADTGYWAESLPLMDAPLCAVIDPIRDYRWHALRCGGPETASFLCEMPVPSWADACNLKDMPNLTLQYMADTASIELIRNCQEEGLLRTMCRGKQDRERAMQDLICPRERLEAQRINDITNSHFKSLQIINSIPSDNNENNDIELLPMEVNYGPHYPEELQTEKNTVQRLIEQFNVDELMQADEPSNMETVSSFYKIPGLIPKPVKKSGKKVLDYNKKSNTKEKPFLEGLQNIKKPLNMEDIMMGDQPLQGEPEISEQLLNEDVSNEILEPLPHIKKTNIHKEDMEKMEKEAIALKKNMQKTKEMENKKMFAMISTTTATSSSTTTTTEAPKTTTSITATTAGKPLAANNEETFVKEKHYDATTTTASISIGHPMHPQQHEQQQQLTLRNQQLFNEDQHQQQQHNIEAADNSHFIPPMLLVKSHYVPPASKHEHHTHSHHLDNTSERNHTAIEDLKETTTMTTTTTVAATAHISDLEKTTLKSHDISSLRSGKRGEENFEETASDSAIKAITEQPTTDTEPQHKNFENLNFKDTSATRMTATTSHPVSYTNNDEDSRQTATVTFAEARDETNKNEEETQELKPPQTANTNAETTATTKLLATAAEKSTEKTAEKLFELQTTEPAVVTTTLPAQQQRITNKQNENEEKEKEELVETTIKTEAATQTPMDTIAKVTENLKNTAEPDNDNKPALIQENVEEEVQLQQEQQQQQQDKKETIVKTTETLGVTTTAVAAAAEIVETENKNEQGNVKEQSTITTLIPKITTTTTTTPITIPTTKVATASISLTTTTTVKPITITTETATIPQNEVKSTETSVSSTSTTTNTNMNTNNNNVNNNSPTNIPTTTPPPAAIARTTITTAINTETSSSTTFKSPAPSTTTQKTTTTETDIETETVTTTATEKVKVVEAAAAEAAAAIEIATPPPLPETTTRNFLKSTTEMPFKPNRRRSLTKPETVSYMKKILG